MKRSTKLRASDELVDQAEPLAGASTADLRVSSERPSGTSQLAGLDAAGRIAALGKAFRTDSGAGHPTAPASGSGIAGLAEALWAHNRRALKALVGLVVVVAVGWMPVRALLETSSTEAVINARLITLRAPIEGQVGPIAAVTAGSEVQSGTALVSVVNPRAERGRVDDLRRLVDDLEGDTQDAHRATRRSRSSAQGACRSGARIPGGTPRSARGTHRRAGQRYRRGRGQA